MTAQSIPIEPEPLPVVTAPVKFTLITSQPALAAVLAANLQAQVSVNDALPPASFEDMTVFHALEPPAISVSDYVARIAKYAFCSEACLVAAYHYINVAVEKEPKLALTSLSVHRLFITAVVLACKYFDDVSYNLMYYSKVGGLPYKELANLEINMLRILDFRLDISAQKFVAIEKQMLTELEICESNPMDGVLSNLVERARSILISADVFPVELTCPSDDVDFPRIVAEKEHARRMFAKKQRSASPATSACTADESSLSRNSSMASVAASDMSVTEDESEAPRPSLKAKQLSVSPATPSSDLARRHPVAMVY